MNHGPVQHVTENKKETATGATAKKGSRCNVENKSTDRYMASAIISPWAKLTTRATPKITERPSAMRP